MEAARRHAPWGASDVRATALAATAGTALATVAWWGSSGTGRLDEQVTWTVLAVVAVILIGVASACWLLAGRRAVATRRAHVLDRLEQTATVAGAGRGAGARADEAAFVVLAGSERYHLGSCILVRGKDARRTSSTSGLRPCEMCAP